MLEDILPMQIANSISKISYKNLCELRLRNNSPIVVNVSGQNYFLTEDSISKSSEGALIVGSGVMQSIMQKLTKHSLYSVNDQLIDGYITYDGGIRVGVCGEIVFINNEVKTIKNISSLNFRFPHMVKNCSLNIYHMLVDGCNIKNTLVVSSPGAGKTTFLKDMIYQLSNREKLLNILVVDERQELVTTFNGNDIEKLYNVDVYSNSSKKYAFRNGIRSMKPDLIVTDEINIDRDLLDIEDAMTSGVKVFASIHANNIFDLKQKSRFNELLQKKLFERFVVLSKVDGVGVVDGVYNHNLNLIGA